MKLSKELIQEYIDKGYSYRKIGRELNISHDKVFWWARKYDIKSNYAKLPPFKIEKIDSKEMAYAIGFLIGDSHVDEKGQLILTIALRDREILEFIAPLFGARILDDKTLNKKQKKYPNTTFSRKVKGILKFFGGRLKDKRRFPIVKKEFERYLLLGFFDAQGTITWGRRKDRNRIWQKVAFTSQPKLLEGVQKMMYNNIGLSSVIRPKGTDNVSVLEMASKKDVLKFINYIYPEDDSFVVLQRKYNRANALRLELGEFRES